MEIDKLEGDVHRLVEQKRRLTADEVGRMVPDALDGYINSFYRSLKNLEAGRELEGRLDALESVSPLLTTAFALEGRVRPFNKYLRHELGQRPLPTLAVDAIERIARDAAPRDQRAAFRHVEHRARERGFGAVIDGWEPTCRGFAVNRPDERPGGWPRLLTPAPPRDAPPRSVVEAFGADGRRNGWTAARAAHGKPAASS